jgi:hypothetical protein
MLETITSSLLGGKIVARPDVIKVDDLDRMALRHCVFDHISGAARNSNEYFLHRPSNILLNRKDNTRYIPRRDPTEVVRFGTRGQLRTAKAGRRMVNFIATMKERHSKKPEELYDMIEHCSPEPFLELFARQGRRGWTQSGDEIPPQSNNAFNGKIVPRPMEGGMIRPYRMPQLALFR